MIGQKIFHYKILEKLGEGGMGEVYLAEDLNLDRKVAIKFLPQHLTKDKENIERFKREAKAAAALNHPNIVTIFEIAEENEQTFIVMEYVDGKTLRELITENSKSRRQADAPSDAFQIPNYVEIIIQLCTGLHEAHQVEIVHRDIKPENIIVTKRGEVKILDFGLAKLKGVSNLTKEASTLGTLHYMSPEQIQGQEIDHRSDIWSLGVVLYEMLMGKVPFTGDYEQAVTYSILHDEPELLAEIPSYLKNIIATCLEKNPSKRYQHAENILASFNADVKEKKSVKTEKRSAFKMLIPVALLLIIIVTTVYFIFLQPTTKKAISDAETWRNSIAVLPFADMSPEQDQEFFCDGMAEEIINALTHIEDLRVIARTSAFAFKGKNEDVRQIGNQLGVKTLLEGSVRKSGNRLRVTTQLVRTSDGAHLWSRTYDRNLTDVFTIQEEIALAIVNQLKIKLLGDEEARVTRRLTENLEAYHQYLRGRHILNRRKAEDIHTAISYFENALQLDSLYVMGYIGLADAYALLPSYASTPSQEAYPKAKAAVYTALRINDQVGEAYASLGWIRMLADWDWKGAEEAFQRSKELNPGYATLNHWYGYLYMMLREFDKALIKVKRALDLDPLSPVINRVVGDVYFNAGQYEQAIPAFKKCLELEPCLPFAHLLLGGCYSRKSLFSEALSEIKKEKECRGPDYTGADYVDGLIYVRMGEMEKAREVLRQLQQYGVKSTGLSQLYFALGDKEMGYKILDDMLDKHDTWITYINSSPGFDQVRHEQRFQVLLKKIGF